MLYAGVVPDIYLYKMLKKYIISLFLFASATAATAQKNRIEIGRNGYKFYAVLDQLGLRQASMVSVKYKRSITERMGIFAGYAVAPVNAWLLVTENSMSDINSVGKIESRKRYHFFDAGLNYSLLKMKRHTLSAGLAASFTFGDNIYKTKLVLAPPPPYGQGDIIDIAYDIRKEYYWGAVTDIRYDFTFWKNRINAGADLAARIYSGGFPFSLNYGIHVGFNF